MDKKSIRKTMLARRREVSSVERAAVSRTVCEQLLARADVGGAIAAGEPIAVYLALPDEIDLTLFIVAALARGAVLVAPRWDGAKYELAALTSLDNLVAGPHNVPEPPPSAPVAEPAVWLVPGVAFTRDGRRLGYGGGWYDRFLGAASSGTVKIGVAYSFQILPEMPVEPHDVKLTEIVR